MQVHYTALNWLDKNRGFVNADLVGMLAASSSPLLNELFQAVHDLF